MSHLPAQAIALIVLLGASSNLVAQCNSDLPRRLPGRALDCEPAITPPPQPLPDIVFPSRTSAEPENAAEEIAEALAVEPLSGEWPDRNGLALEGEEEVGLVPPQAEPDLNPPPRPRLGRVIRERTQAPLERVPNPVSPVPRPGLEDYRDAIAVPDRWRIVDALGYQTSYLDPYNASPLKADKPFRGEWFFNLGVLSDTVYESRELVTRAGDSSVSHSISGDELGGYDQSFVNETLLLETVLYKGDTVFRPPDYEFRLTTAFNYNYTKADEAGVLNIDPFTGKSRKDRHVGLQAAFVGKHLRTVSDRYDFDSVRVGIQPFNADFRGFLFQDNQLGLRFFGSRNNNVLQYNVAFFQRLEKDINSRLNDLAQPPRKDYVLAANLYWQDLFIPGFTSLFSVVHNRNREAGERIYNSNGFVARPAALGRAASRGYDVSYLGYSGDGHVGRLNLSTTAYFAFGSEDSGVFSSEQTDIRAGFMAAELSTDFDWIRPRLSLLYASGDDDPFDSTARGFDSIMENPQFAGSDASYWIRQSIPLLGDTGVRLSSRNGVLNSLRSSKEQGQSNFSNPGALLLGLGVDLDVLPQLRLSANWNRLSFADTAVLEAVRGGDTIHADIGDDVSLSAIYRPLNSQNIILRASYSQLLPGSGYKDLFEDENAEYFFLNLLFSY